MTRSHSSIDQLIINSPYVKPREYWAYDRETRSFERREGRRPAGYVVATPGAMAFDDPGQFVELPLVNQIRPRVDAWRSAGYPGVTGITRRLLTHWNDTEEREGHRFFFCQLEAIETLIWLAEVHPSDPQGISVPGDGGPIPRLCNKMATGSGKTILMAMIVAWQILNRVASPTDKRFSKHIFVVAPGLTVKNRLQVLLPSTPGNYYDVFNIVPTGLRDGLRQGAVVVRNWHALQWESEERVAKRRSVDKRGTRSDEAYVRAVLGELSNARNIVVINDEAHHAWRVNTASNAKGVSREDLEQATKWVAGLDRINRARGILNCFDVSATPFAPSGKVTREEALFGWIVSDFGLNDAIEAGLVKTPRVVVRDDATPDAKTFRSRLFHIYNDEEVKDDLNRKAEEHELLPDLVINAYYLLGKDWLETAQRWRKDGVEAPPVMMTVANRTETAARIKFAFDHGKVAIDELRAPDRTLHIDSKVLEQAEAQEEAVSITPAVSSGDEETDDAGPKLTKKQQAELLRLMVDTVGQPGKPGAMIQNVISVGMLSEGWDAKTVTHIMGLRAFSSQLLCEQVVGRGLRRTSYEVNKLTGLFEPEYVNIFGVPFTFLPHEGGDEAPPPPPVHKTRIEPDSRKSEFELTWPNVIRIDRVFRPRLSLDLERVASLELNARSMAFAAELAPILEGKPDLTKLSEIELDDLGRRFRQQTIIFKAAVELFEQMQPAWRGTREYLLGQLVRLVEGFLRSDRIKIVPLAFGDDPNRRQLLFTLSMSRIVHHIWAAIRCENTETLVPIFDRERPIMSTSGMPTWFTGKPCHPAGRSHINFCVYDSTWEASEAFAIEKNSAVEAWAKNDHLGFEILYLFQGAVRKYRPDFIVRLDGVTLVLEIKGQNTEEAKAKRAALDEWVTAVNAEGRFGRWAAGIVFQPGEVDDVIARVAKSARMKTTGTAVRA